MAIKSVFNDGKSLTANQAAKQWIMDCIDARVPERTTETDREWTAFQEALDKQQVRLYKLLGMRKINS